MQVILNDREWAAFMTGIIHGRKMKEGTEVVESNTGMNTEPITSDKNATIGIYGDEVEIIDNSIGTRVVVPIWVKYNNIGIAGYSLRVKVGSRLKYVGYSMGTYVPDNFNIEETSDGLYCFGQSSENSKPVQISLVNVEVELTSSSNRYEIQVIGSNNYIDINNSTLLTIADNGQLSFITPIKYSNGVISYLTDKDKNEKENSAKTPSQNLGNYNLGSGGSGSLGGNLTGYVGNLTGGYTLNLYIGGYSRITFYLSGLMISNGWYINSSGGISKYFTYEDYLANNGMFNEKLDFELIPEEPCEFEPELSIEVEADNEDDKPYILIPFGGFKFVFKVENAKGDMTVPTPDIKIVRLGAVNIRDMHMIDIATNSGSDTDILLDKLRVYDVYTEDEIVASTSKYKTLTDSIHIADKHIIDIEKIIHEPTEYIEDILSQVGIADVNDVLSIYTTSSDGNISDIGAITDLIDTVCISAGIKDSLYGDIVEIGDSVIIE